jgi:hypothetical protein
MPRRVDARWGRTGMIRLDGQGQVDDRQNGTDRMEDDAKLDRGHQGFLLNDSQFKSLIRGLDPSKYVGREAQLRAELNFIRNFVLKSYLRDAQTPTWAEMRTALVETSRRVRALLGRISDLAFLPDWDLPDSAAIEDPSPFQVLVTLPSRLRACAERARLEAKMNKERALLMIAVADAADDLADILMALDFASQNELLKHLAWQTDYDMNHLAEIIRIVERVQAGINDAANTKRGGPLPKNDLRQATIWLADLFERYKGTFTHNPYDKTKYDGRPHSAAGKFVLEFLRTCDSTITEQTVSQYVAEAVRFRRRERGSKRVGRETSS